MIRRIGDLEGVFNEIDLENIHTVLKKAESKKLFDTFTDKKQAEVAEQELKVMGFKVEKVEKDNTIEVFAITPESVSYDDAMKSGSFRKVAWGRYIFEKQAGIGMFKFPYDDGSIWRISNDEQGKPVLIKEIDDEKEEIVRVPANTLQKTANDSESPEIRNEQLVNVAIMLSGNNIGKFFQDLFDRAPQAKQAVLTMVNEKVKTLVAGKMTEKNVPNDMREAIMAETSKLIFEGKLTTVKGIEACVTSLQKQGKK